MAFDDFVTLAKKNNNVIETKLTRVSFFGNAVFTTSDVNYSDEISVGIIGGMSLVDSIEKVLEDGRHYTPTAIANALGLDANSVAQVLKSNPNKFRDARYVSKNTGENFYVIASLKPTLRERFSRFVYHLDNVVPL